MLFQLSYTNTVAGKYTIYCQQVMNQTRDNIIFMENIAATCYQNLRAYPFIPGLRTLFVIDSVQFIFISIKFLINQYFFSSFYEQKSEWKEYIYN